MQSPRIFVRHLRRFNGDTQASVCVHAGWADGGGMGEEGLARARHALSSISGRAARDCLAIIEEADRKTREDNEE